MNTEKMKHHIDALKQKHRKIDAIVESMESVGSYDDMDLQNFKKQRLALKDEISHFEHQLDADIG